MHIVCVLKLKGHTQEAPAGTAKGVIVPEKGKHDKHAVLRRTLSWHMCNVT